MEKYSYFSISKTRPATILTMYSTHNRKLRVVVVTANSAKKSNDLGPGVKIKN